MKSRRIAIRHRRKTEPIVWIIDSEQWPRSLLRAELIERGYNAVGFIKINDAFDALRLGTMPKPAVLILESRGQTISETALQEIEKLGFPTILLGGNAELHDPLLQKKGWDIVLKRPVTIGKIADTVETIQISLTRHRRNA